jgi:urease accessory protein UreH
MADFSLVLHANEQCGFFLEGGGGVQRGDYQVFELDLGAEAVVRLMMNIVQCVRKVAVHL